MSNTPYADAVSKLTKEAADLVQADIRAMMLEAKEFDTLASAREELRRRIGGWENLSSYADCLVADKHRKEKADAYWAAKRKAYPARRLNR